MSDLLFKQLYKSSLRFLGIRLRSVYEMRQKLQVWLRDQEGLSSEERHIIEDRVIDQLFKDRFLDDERFAQEWVVSRTRSKPRGEVVIRAELQRKGVEREVIDSALASILHTKNEEGVDVAYASALSVGMKYWKKYSVLPQREGVYKLMGVLARKGYSRSIINRVVDDLLARG